MHPCPEGIFPQNSHNIRLNWTGNAEYDLQYEQHKFRFIDDMILTERVDYESVNRCLKEYSKEINSKIETNIDEPVYISCSSNLFVISSNFSITNFNVLTLL